MRRHVPWGFGMRLGWPRYLAELLALAVVYLAAAKLGLRIGFVEQVSAVWPPTGIALIAILLLGERLWPAVAAGAFLANLTANEPAIVAAGIAVGNTLEALLGAWLLRRVVGFRPELDRLMDVLGLVLLAALLSTAVSATIGVACLCVGGVQPRADYGTLWGVWWLGDAVGDLIMAPLLFTAISAGARGWFRQRAGELVALFGGLVVVCLVVFAGQFAPVSRGGLPLEYTIFPFVIWAALRCGPTVTALVVFVASAIAIWGTLNDFGPFVRSRDRESLVLLQIFMVVVAVTGLVLAATSAERQRAAAALLQRAAELVEADRRKDEFLAMLAHELRNPLAPIRNAVEALHAPTRDESRLDWGRDMIERQVRQLTRLVDDLLDVSRITRGQIQLRKERVALAAVVARAVETSLPLVDTRKHELRVELPGEPVWLDADPTRLEQVLANLLNNAAKFTPEGGHIRLTAERDKGQVTIRIRDDGMGIPAAMLPRLFQPFTQGAETRNRAQGGLGLGLALAKSLVHLHGGSVTAQSQGPGRGSEFSVRLPVSPPEKAQATAEANGPSAGTAERSARPRRRILVVDDNVDAAQSLAMLLELEGHDVQVAHNGVSALRVAQAERPEIVLLDIGLPQMDGYEVARRLREQDRSPRMMLVAVTGYGQDEDRRRSRDAGFDAHLVKPVEPATLKELLAQR